MGRQPTFMILWVTQGPDNGASASRAPVQPHMAELHIQCILQTGHTHAPRQANNYGPVQKPSRNRPQGCSVPFVCKCLQPPPSPRISLPHGFSHANSTPCRLGFRPGPPWPTTAFKGRPWIDPLFCSRSHQVLANFGLLRPSLVSQGWPKLYVFFVSLS